MFYKNKKKKKEKECHFFPHNLPWWQSFQELPSFNWIQIEKFTYQKFRHICWNWFEKATEKNWKEKKKSAAHQSESDNIEWLIERYFQVQTMETSIYLLLQFIVSVCARMYYEIRFNLHLVSMIFQYYYNIWDSKINWVISRWLEKNRIPPYLFTFVCFAICIVRNVKMKKISMYCASTCGKYTWESYMISINVFFLLFLSLI